MTEAVLLKVIKNSAIRLCWGRRNTSKRGQFLPPTGFDPAGSQQVLQAMAAHPNEYVDWQALYDAQGGSLPSALQGPQQNALNAALYRPQEIQVRPAYGS